MSTPEGTNWSNAYGITGAIGIVVFFAIISAIIFSFAGCAEKPKYIHACPGCQLAGAPK